MRLATVLATLLAARLLTAASPKKKFQDTMPGCSPKGKEGKDGCSNNDVTKVISQVAEAYKCTPVEGVLSHQMKKHVIDANKTIINKATTDQQVPEAAVNKNDVFAIDIVMSTGEGKPKQASTAHPARYCRRFRARPGAYHLARHLLARRFARHLLTRGLAPGDRAATARRCSSATSRKSTRSR